MEHTKFDLRCQNDDRLGAVKVFAEYHNDLYCSFKVLDEQGYLFTLVPANDPFTDFELSERDKFINQDVDFGILQRVKCAIVDYFL